MKGIWYLILLLAITGSQTLHLNAQTQKEKSWIQDIDILTAAVEKHHPAPWDKISRDAFFREAGKIKAGCSGKSAEEITVEIMALVSLLRDGHTRVWLNNQTSFNIWFPVRLEKFADGIFITAAAARHSDLLKTKVIRLGEMDVDHACRLVGSITAADSEHGLPRIITNHLSNAQILKALKILKTADRLPLELEWPDGTRRQVTLEAGEWDLNFKWAYLKKEVPTYDNKTGIFDDRVEHLPAYLRKVWPSLESYWFEFFPEDKLFYFQFNEVTDVRNEPFGAFTERLFQTYDRHARDVEKFVIDLRFNEGGNGDLLRPLVHGFIRREAELPRGKLYILTGPQTFSAASNFIGQMLKNTRAITAGDIAGPVNWCSDTIKIVLANSRLLVDISTMFWQEGHPTDTRGYYPPEYYIPALAEDYFSGKDVVLEAVKNGRAQPLKDVLLKDGAEAFRAEFDRLQGRYGPPEKWFPYLSFDLTIFSFFDLGRAGKIDEAAALSRLNTRLYPHEARAWWALAMICEAQKNLPEALACFERVMSLDPHYAEAEWHVERLKTLLHPAAIEEAQLKNCAGRFGTRTLSFENGALFYRREGGDKIRLIPVSAVCFLMEGDNNNRIEIVLTGGNVAGIKVTHYNGTSRFYKKTEP